jgi:mannosyl-glycoprotein endo-beta-N-acetylglucosaminidase
MLGSRIALLALAFVATCFAGTARADDRPATVPLKNLRELADWKPGDTPWNAATVPLAARPVANYAFADLWVPRAPSQNGKGRMIVMHDMAGGYAPDQDRFPDGNNNDRLYRFTYWQYADTFIYFAHDRVSFPPPGWTNSAHRNGVLSLGTFDIEGQSLDAEVRELLDDKQKRRRYAEKLAEIARAYRFDGWLVNIEVPMPGGERQQSERAASLRDFVAELRAAIHKLSPRHEVIWYDSITRKGTLSYQDELNAKNKMFFAAADGLTTNYDWSPPIRHGSPKNSAKLAGNRALSVYTSVDVFPRPGNFRRYSGFRSYEGVRVALRARTSAGIFAPGWTYEGDGADPDRGNFPKRDAHFWLGTAGEALPEGGVAEYLAARPAPSALPFLTNFGQGIGQATYERGVRISDAKWGNVGKIDVMPTFRRLQIDGSDSYKADLTTDAAYTGGSSFRIEASNPAGHSLRPLFRSAFEGVAGAGYAVRPDGLDAALVLVTADRDAAKPVVHLLMPSGSGAPPANVDYHLGNRSGEPARVEIVRPRSEVDEHSWRRRTYDLSRLLGDRTVAAIGVLAFPVGEAGKRVRVDLGEISLR